MQTILIYVLTGIAVLYIARRAYRTLARKQHAGCEHCSASDMQSGSHSKVTPAK